VGRRLVYLAAGALIGITLLFALVWSDARLSFVFLAAALGAGSWWLTRQLPSGPVTVWEMRAAAALALVLGILLALAVPTTRIPCDCPVPQGITGAYDCGCAVVDGHVGLRVAIAVLGVLLSVAFAIGARRRPFRLWRAHDQEVA
jgi:hypothetical protein